MVGGMIILEGEIKSYLVCFVVVARVNNVEGCTVSICPMMTSSSC